MAADNVECFVNAETSGREQVIADVQAGLVLMLRPVHARDSVATAFREAGEPLTVRLDMAVADPGSAVDVIFVPAPDDVAEPPFEVTVFEAIDAAEQHVQSLEAGSPAGTNVLRARNVVVTISPSLEDDREEKIVTGLHALDS